VDAFEEGETLDAEARIVCLVTIHGIGFQQPPILAHGSDPGMDGYADDLHRNLRAVLDRLLSDDPKPKNPRDGKAPIYVQNRAPADDTIAASDLDRLGKWSTETGRTITKDEAPLVTDDNKARIAHIALVYADLEERTAKLGSSLEAIAKSLVSLGHYATVGGLIQMLAQDAVAMAPDDSPLRALIHSVENVMAGHPTSQKRTPSLRVRTDAGAPTAGRAPYHEDVSGLLATVRQLENDVAAYVCRNDLRTRVRGFVRDALCRLAYRPDVAAIVVNSHSNGTPIAYDVLHELTPSAMKSVRALITAGSPLRKYADLFTWGTEIGNIRLIERVDPFEPWLNFWDPRDPVADPLEPDANWRPGQPPGQPTVGFFHVGDAPDERKPAPVKDHRVDNLVNNHGTGLRAHNYWDNKEQEGLVCQLAKLLARCCNTTARADVAEPV
jgi:hypothetical protein